MGLMRALATFTQRKLQEELDIWRLYHLLHYFQLCGGKEIRVPKPKEISFNKQYYAVHSAVTKQVAIAVHDLANRYAPTALGTQHL